MTQSKTPPIRRGFPFSQFKAVDDTAGAFEGYMSVFNLEDDGGDIVEPGAFNKTLSELRAKQVSRQAQGVPAGRYLLPLFWGHDSQVCIGGIMDAKEDAHGVYVHGELDLNVEQARNAYSGLKSGYIPGMSFGYFAIKSSYDRLGVRHLKELSVFEATITPIPMHSGALVTEVKSATGKATWPLGERDAAWDGAGAHKRIVAWATGSDGTVDVGKLQSVHFYSPDGDAKENVSQYKLLFCDVADGGKVTAMPKGIFACAGSHGVEATTGISADDQDAIKSKISAYYARMAKAFDDDSLKAPWDDDGKKELDMKRREAKEVKGSGGTLTINSDGTHAAYTGTHTHAHSAFKTQGGDDMHEHEHTHDGDSVHKHEHANSSKSLNTDRPYRKARDFDTLFQSLSASDQLQDDWGDTFIAFTQCMSELMWQAHAQTNGYLMPEEPTADIPEAAQANIDAFSKAVMVLVTRSLAADFVPQIDWDGDQFIDPDGPNAGEDDDCKPGYYSRDLTDAQTKAGRVMSAANHKAMSAMLDDMAKGVKSLSATHKALSTFHAKVDPNATQKPDSSGNGNDAPAGDATSTSSDTGQSSQSGGKSLTSPTGAGAQISSTTDATTPLTADEMSRMLRERMRAQRDAARLADGLAQAIAH